jgi:hypothetical protein
MRGLSGIFDLDALRRGGSFEVTVERDDLDSLFRDLEARRAAAGSPQSPLYEIVPHLAEALRRLADDSHLVIGVHGSERYGQFATFRPNLRLETIGPRYFEQDGDVMPLDELVWLAEHGWHDADDGGNLWREWIPAAEGAAALAAVEALVEVHGVTEVAQVWFRSEDDDALSALDGYKPPPPPTPAGLQPTSPARKAAINAALRRSQAPGRARLPDGSRCVAVVDYVDSRAVLEVLGLVGARVYRRNDGHWRDDSGWLEVLPGAPARSITPLTQAQFDKVIAQVDRSTAGKPWKPFKPSGLERYWPSHRPNDPDLFDWATLDSLPTLHEP